MYAYQQRFGRLKHTTILVFNYTSISFLLLSACVCISLYLMYTHNIVHVCLPQADCYTFSTRFSSSHLKCVYMYVLPPTPPPRLIYAII